MSPATDEALTQTGIALKGASAAHRRSTFSADNVFAAVLLTLGGSILVIAGLIVFVLAKASSPAISKIGLWDFLKGTDWDPIQSAFGALPFIYGTLVTSAISLALAVPISLGVAIFLNEIAPARLKPLVTFPLELLAGIPSVVYGLWGLFVLVPWNRNFLEPFLSSAFGHLPFFQGPPVGLGYLAAGLILAVMILPTITLVGMEVLKAVPGSLREASLALGATRWEMVRMAVLPYSRAGILGAVLLGLGRAVGETMAVTMVIGNSPTIQGSLLAPGYSLPSVIANEFAEATTAEHTGALAGLALVLFGITLLLNSIARLLVRLVKRGPSGVVA